MNSPRPIRSIRSTCAAAAACLLVLVTGAAAGVAAQEPDAADASAAPDTLGMREAVRTAVERGREVQISRAGLAEAEEQVSEAWGNVFPSVDFVGSYTRNVSPQVSFLPARIIDPDAPEGEFLPVQFGADNSWRSSITVEQPLFEARAFIGVSTAGRFQELQDEVVRGAVHETVTRVRTAYVDLLLAQERIRVTENSLERVRQSLRETRAMNEAGIASDYDVLRLEVELANLEPELRRARNDATSARRDLAVELDVEDPDRLHVAGSLADLDLESPEENTPANREILAFTGLHPGEDPDVDALVERARSRRSDVLQADAQVDLRHAELRVEQAEYLPRVFLFGSYDIQAQQNGPPEFFGSGMNRAYSRNVGLEVRVPLFTGLRRDARVDQRRAVLRRARTEAQLTRDRAANEVLDLVDDVEEARLRAEAQELAVQQARRGYEIASAEYREGVAGQLQLTDAEVALRESEFNYAEAVRDYLAARARLDRAVGEVPDATPGRGLR